MSDDNNRSIFREIFSDGVVKFAGVLLIAVFWYFLPAEAAKRSAINDAEFVELCKTGNAVKVSRAIKNDANVNAKDNDGYTALIMAVVDGHTETAELLLKHGADVNAEDNRGFTVLMIAVLRGHEETTKLLRSYGAKE